MGHAQCHIFQLLTSSIIRKLKVAHLLYVRRVAGPLFGGGIDCHVFGIFLSGAPKNAENRHQGEHRANKGGADNHDDEAAEEPKPKHLRKREKSRVSPRGRGSGFVKDRAIKNDICKGLHLTSAREQHAPY